MRAVVRASSNKVASPALSFFLAGLFLFAGLVLAVFTRVFLGRAGKDARLCWGTEPLVNNVYWSRALSEAGWDSETFTTMYYSISQRSDWNRLLDEEFKAFPSLTRPYLGFLRAIPKYDVFFLSFRGLFLGETRLWRVQHFFLRLAKKKVVILPYGSDSYVYRRIRSLGTAHGLMVSYPQAAREQKEIASRVDYWVKRADFLIPGFMGADGIGRWDVNIPSPLFIDVNQWQVSCRVNDSSGTQLPVVIAHTPNHRGFKGTEFLLHAVDVLKIEGLSVELLLLEGVTNEEVRKNFSKKADILVEQLIFDGYAMSGLEGMASGLPVVANLNNDDLMIQFRRWSYLGECPIVSADPENVVDVLRALVRHPQLRQDLGDAGRKYVEKYHGLDSANFLFENVIASMQGEPIDLMGVYHPLTGEYPDRLPMIEHPLQNNRLPEDMLT